MTADEIREKTKRLCRLVAVEGAEEGMDAGSAERDSEIHAQARELLRAFYEEGLKFTSITTPSRRLEKGDGTPLRLPEGTQPVTVPMTAVDMGDTGAAAQVFEAADTVTAEDVDLAEQSWADEVPGEEWPENEDDDETDPHALKGTFSDGSSV